MLVIVHTIKYCNDVRKNDQTEQDIWILIPNWKKKSVILKKQNEY